jgi:NAD(P)-dependent dehydrogenase (short-subunit alcohol dehydrogenase family)
MTGTKSFLGKTVIISGSSKGIGRELARSFGNMGANLVINGSNADALNATFHEFKALGYNVVAVKGNVADIRECYQLAEAAINTFGSIDILVANAGVKTRGSLEALNPMAIKQVMDVNYLGTVYLIKACLPYLKKSKGNILITGSASGFRGIPGAGVYTASKMALTALADSLRIELIHTGVNISLAYLGFTENDSDKHLVDTPGVSSKEKNGVPGKVASQQAVSMKMIRMIQRNEFKRTFSFLGKVNEFVSRFLPSLGNYIMKRYYLKTYASASTELD